MSSKREFEAFMAIFNNVVKGLTNKEFDNILNGSATLKYVEKSISTNEKYYFNLIIEKILYMKSDLTDKLEFLKNEKELDNKNQLYSFCNYLNIDSKSKDTKSDLANKILEYIENNSEILKARIEEGKNIDQEISDIAKKIESFNDIENAKQYLFENIHLRSKTNALLLAKILDVNVKKDQNSEDILHRIIDSVVGSKLRSYAIRKESKKF